MKKLHLDHLINNKSDLDKIIGSSFYNLSGGEIQRIGLIRTFIKNKVIEIYDEPTTFLDKELSEIVTEILVERSEEKLILIATHDKYLINRSSKTINLNSIN